MQQDEFYGVSHFEANASTAGVMFELDHDFDRFDLQEGTDIEPVQGDRQRSLPGVCTSKLNRRPKYNLNDRFNFDSRQPLQATDGLEYSGVFKLAHPASRKMDTRWCFERSLANGKADDLRSACHIFVEK